MKNGLMKSRLGKGNKSTVLAGAFGLLLALALIMGFMVPAAVAQPPTFPHKFWGNVTYCDGATPAPENTRVDARIEAKGLEWTTYTDALGRYGYETSFYVEEDDGAAAGDVITFWVDGVQADTTCTFGNVDAPCPDPPDGPILFVSNGRNQIELHVPVAPYSLTVNSEGCCPIEVSWDQTLQATVPAGGTDVFEFDVITFVTLEADDSDVCCDFVEWTGDATGTDNPIDVTVNGHLEVTGNCDLLGPFDLTVEANPAEGGTVTGSGTYDCCTDVEITATPADECWEFIDWTGDVDDPQSPTTTTHIDGDKTVTANFEKIEYELTVEANPAEGGTVTGSGTYDCCTDVQITATPAQGWAFEDWTGDVADPDSPTTTTHIDGDKTVTANFVTEGDYSLTVNSEGCCPIEVSWDQTLQATVPAGGTDVFSFDVVTVVTLEADDSDVCCDFTEWTGAATGTDNPIDVTVDGHLEVTGNCDLLGPFDLTVEANPAEGGTVTGSGTYDCCTDVQITATPADECWEFIDWTGDVDDPQSPTTTTHIDGDKTVTANFEKIEYELTVEANPAEGGTVTGSGTYDCCTDVQITATPADEGWAFDNWTGDVADPDSPTTTTHIDGDKTVTANFVPTGDYSLTVNSEGCCPIEVSWDQTLQATVPAGGSGVFDFDVATVVTLEADDSDICCGPVEWTGAATGTDNPIDVTVDGHLEVTGTCTPLGPFVLTVEAHPAEGGTVTGSGTYDCCTDVQITATPADGWVFLAWTGDVTDRDSQTTTTHIDGDKTVTANFAEEGVLAEIDIGMGWRTFSTPVALDPNYNTWGDLAALGGFDWVIAYFYDCEAEQWVQVVVGDEIWPCDAIYVLMAEAGTVPIIPDPWATPPCIKELCAGWNLVGLSSLVDMTVVQALATVYVVGIVEGDCCPAGDLTGYAQVLSPDVNEPDHWVYVRDWPTNPIMVVGKGYWVFMINPGTLGGFTSTPVLSGQ